MSGKGTSTTGRFTEAEMSSVVRAFMEMRETAEVVRDERDDLKEEVEFLRQSIRGVPELTARAEKAEKRAEMLATRELIVMKQRDEWKKQWDEQSMRDARRIEHLEARIAELETAVEWAKAKGFVQIGSVIADRLVGKVVREREEC